MNLKEQRLEAAKNKALSLLNSRKPQYPPDVYYIRRNQQALNKFLDDKDQIRSLQKDQTPQQRLSYQMFQLTEADRDSISKNKIVPRMQVSDKDPFMNRPKQIWRGFHKPIASTEEIMESLEPYETRKATVNGSMDRFVDQEKRYYTETAEMQREASKNINQKRQMETLSNPEEAAKIQLLQKELSTSQYLTEVNSEFNQFEEATNKHFNREMNKEQRAQGLSVNTTKLTKKYADQVIADISKQLMMAAGGEKSRKASAEHQPTEAQMSERYDRMSRKDFSRKINSFVPVLVNDSYSNFRFSKRAGEVLSPLSTSKFGFGNSKNIRKLSLALRSEAQSVRNSEQLGGTGDQSGFNRLSNKQARHKSVTVGETFNATGQASMFKTSSRRASHQPENSMMGGKKVAELNHTYN